MSSSHYVKFRYSFEPNSVITADVAEQFVDTFIHRIFYKQNLIDVVAGYETLDRTGRPTHPHVHIHFNTIEEPAKIRDRFRKWIKANTTDTRTRCALYSMKEEDDIDCDRFFRYPLKQCHDFNSALRKHCVVNSFPFDVAMQTFAANDEYRRSSVAANLKLERLNKPSTYDRIEEHLLALHLHEPTEREICAHIVDFYRANRIPFDLAKLMIHCTNFRANHAFMTTDEIVDHALRTM